MSKKIEYLKQLFQDFEGALPEGMQQENSVMKYNVLADGVYWTDEGLDGIHWELSNAFRLVLNYRTKLLTNEKNNENKSEYYLAKKYFPKWIGFSESRCSFNEELTSKIKRIQKVSNYKIDKAFKESDLQVDIIDPTDS